MEFGAIVAPAVRRLIISSALITSGWCRVEFAAAYKRSFRILYGSSVPQIDIADQNTTLPINVNCSCGTSPLERPGERGPGESLQFDNVLYRAGGPAEVNKGFELVYDLGLVGANYFSASAIGNNFEGRLALAAARVVATLLKNTNLAE